MRKVDPEKHAARRQAILDAARTCFARKGFHQTSTAEICAAVGMSPGNLFHYFPNKQEIIGAIVDQEGEETAAFFQTLGARDDLHAALLDFMDLVLELAADAEFSSLALEISAEAGRDPAIAMRVGRNDRELRSALQGLLAEAAARGQADATLDMADAATWVAALIDGIFSRVAVDGEFKPKNQHATMRVLLGRFLRPRADVSTMTAGA
ncbi:TetR/AcrR family transcriptional regulator [Aminobacter niigataensis]|uniref:TetR/AcrR family transcriptional regulator n=1 Tax=Aminobacter niigataensis TaxID=83265 RepID=UPI0024CA8F8F|nr:TetR/AcrR family transcriptional regulator [Aminobacter niigataensis]CAI2933710.1 HTH-type transcriptional repressor AcnR [Aminobacter niigataensis]